MGRSTAKISAAKTSSAKSSAQKTAARGHASKVANLKAAPGSKKKALEKKSLPEKKISADKKIVAEKKIISEKKMINGAAATVSAKDTKLIRQPGLAKEVSFKEEAMKVIKEDFKVGDKVVYPAHGVGSIESIQARRISGAEQKFYMLTILETGMKIMVPTSQVNTVGLRKVVDSKTVDKVYDILRDRNVILDSQTWNRRYREYTQKIKTGSVFEIAKVIRDLSVLKTDKELSFGERKMLDTAQGLLVKEISIAKARPEDTIRAELQELFQPSVN